MASVRREKWGRVKDRIRNLPAARPPVEKEPPPWRTVLLSEEHLDALIKLDWLPREQRASRTAIQTALSRYLYSSLVERHVHMLWAKVAREERQAGRQPGA